MFFCRADYLAYLGLLRKHARQHAMEIVAYCLMPNHIHLVVCPDGPNGMNRALRAVHGQYAQRINRMKAQQGHLWQARYFSSPLDAEYFLNAIRYVELNPVRARMTSSAEDYCWSSAAAHCGLRNDPIVDPRPRSTLLAGIKNWSRWLSEGITDDSLNTLRLHGGQNLPCGSSQFVAELEKIARRKLRYQPPGRLPEAKRDSHL